jgi:hypothetical protein
MHASIDIQELLVNTMQNFLHAMHKFGKKGWENIANGENILPGQKCIASYSKKKKF